MAMKKDDDKSKRTLSGKKPATFGGANSKLIKPKASAPSGPRAEPPRPMGKDATGSANFNRTAPSRATVSVGPATLSMGGKTSKSTGGMDMSKGKVQPKKSSNPTAKLNLSGKLPYPKPSNNAELDANDAFSDRRERRQMRTAVGATALGTGIGLNFAGGGNKIKDAVKYIKDTPKRRAKKAEEKAEKAAMIVESNKGKGKITASRSTMRKIKRLGK
jgi:hypothetical protein